MGLTVYVSADEVGKELGDDADFAGEVFNEVAYYMGNEIGQKWLRDFVAAVDVDARTLIKAIAAAIEADEASEGGA